MVATDFPPHRGGRDDGDEQPAHPTLVLVATFVVVVSFLLVLAWLG